MNDLDLALGLVGGVTVIGSYKGARGWRVTVGNDVFQASGTGATFTEAALAAVRGIREEIARAMGGVAVA